MALPLTCTLDPTDLRDRLQAWRRVAASATDHRIEGDLISARYPKDEHLLQQIRELIAAETMCCSLLQFRVEEGTDYIRTDLRVPPDLPPSTRALVFEIMGWPRPGASRG